MTNRDKLRELTSTLTALGHSLTDEDLSEQILHVARELRGATLHGSFPDRSILASLVGLLKSLDIEFAVIGGVAVSIHGVERDTDDLDVLISKMPDDDKLRDSEFMGKFGFYKTKSATGTMLILDHKQGGCEALLANTSERKWALQTAREESVLGLRVPVVSPEALIVLKLKALSNNQKRKKDEPDILGVLNENDALDFDTVESHLTKSEKERLDWLRKKG